MASRSANLGTVMGAFRGAKTFVQGAGVLRLCETSLRDVSAPLQDDKGNIVIPRNWCAQAGNCVRYSIIFALTENA